MREDGDGRRGEEEGKKEERQGVREGTGEEGRER